jgi:hypothetical protein
LQNQICYKKQGIYPVFLFRGIIMAGASSDQNLLSSAILEGGVTIGTVSVDPRTTAVTSNGQALVVGSVLKNTTTGQKYYKFGAGTMDFAAIPITPPAEWGWDASANEAWAVLNSF